MSEPNQNPEKQQRQVIGGFEIISMIGRGGMGAVYRARQISTDRIVALKILPPRLARNEQFVARFLREAQSAARLNHSNIVQAYDAGKADGYHYFAMEFIDGQSLSEQLKKEGRLPEKRALEIVRDIARALEYAHGAGLIHRDIKPENILIANDGAAKLADLGLARETTATESHLTQTGTALGTPNYIAPEQVRGEADLDGRCDLYSLGATLYHLLAGAPPFIGGTANEVMAKHLVEQVPDCRKVAPEISYEAAQVIRRAMAKPREHRYQNAMEFLADVERLLSAHVDGTITFPAQAEPTQPPKTQKWLVYVGAFAALIAAALLGKHYLIPAKPVVEVATPVETTQPAEATPEAALPVESPKYNELRSNIYDLTAQKQYGRAFRCLDQFAQANNTQTDRVIVKELRDQVRTSSDRSFREAARLADRALANGDFAGARAALEAARELDIPDMTTTINSRVAEIARAEHRTQLMQEWMKQRAAIRQLISDKRYADAERLIADARKLPKDIAGEDCDTMLADIAAKRQAELDSAIADYRAQSDEMWILLKSRFYAEAEEKFASFAKNPRFAPASRLIQADELALRLLKEFWVIVEKRLVEKKGEFIAFAGTGGTISAVENGEVRIIVGDHEDTRRIQQLAAKQAMEYAKQATENAKDKLKTYPNAGLVRAVFQLAENVNLPEIGKDFDAADNVPEAQVFRERLEALIRAEQEAAAAELWKQISALGATQPFGRAERTQILKLLDDFTAKYDKTKFAASIKPQLSALRVKILPVYDRWPFDESEAKRRQAETAKILGIPITKTIDIKGLKLELVLIPAGVFVMGESAGDPFGLMNPEHRVTITRPFYIARFETTQGQWERLMPRQAIRPGLRQNPNEPAMNLSWDDCQRFITRAGEISGVKLRFPTEAEWELACRAGTNTNYYFGDTINQTKAAYRERPSDMPSPVGSFRPNAFGIYDMHGNAAEWCSDWFSLLNASEQTNPKGPRVATKRVLRGGSWNMHSQNVRSAARLPQDPKLTLQNCSGLRLAADCLDTDDAGRKDETAVKPPVRLKFASRPGMPELEWQEGSPFVRGLNGETQAWRIELPLEIGEVREQKGLWLIISTDKSIEAEIGPVDGRIIRMRRNQTK